MVCDEYMLSGVLPRPLKQPCGTRLESGLLQSDQAAVALVAGLVHLSIRTFPDLRRRQRRVSIALEGRSENRRSRPQSHAPSRASRTPR